MWHMIFPCCLCNMLNMLDSPSTFSTCFCPVRVGQTNMDGNKLTSSTFYSEVHFEYHMTAGSSSSFFKIFFQILVDFQDFWGFKFISEWIMSWLAAKCSIRMISDLSRSIRTRDWPTSRLVQYIWSNITVFVDRF